MNEIEKLYSLVGVKLRKVCTHVDCDCDEMLCDECEYFKDNIFAFTAEKQIELIRWLSRRRLLNITFSNDKSTYQLFNDKCSGSFCTDLATAIATLVQCELDFCTEQEKQEIKRILE